MEKALGSSSLLTTVIVIGPGILGSRSPSSRMRWLGRRRDHRRVAKRLCQWAQLPSRGTFGLLPHYVSSASAPTRATAAANWPGSSARSVAPPPSPALGRSRRKRSAAGQMYPARQLSPLAQALGHASVVPTASEPPHPAAGTSAGIPVPGPITIILVRRDELPRAFSLVQ